MATAKNPQKATYKKAATKAAAPAAPARRTIVDPDAAAAAGSTKIAANGQVIARHPNFVTNGADDKVVTVSVPKTFTILDDERIKHIYVAGTTEMPESHAKHAYAVANGVVIKK
jgi:hypothetical protein